MGTNQASPNEPVSEYSSDEHSIIQDALRILESRLKYGKTFSDASAAKHFCQLKLGHEKDEYFACLYLDGRHRLLSFEKLFRGSVSSATVHARVVVRRALELNAAALIVSHNHPSGETSPSKSDIALTQKLKDALRVVDVNLLDHIVVSAEGNSSLAESGLI